MTNKSTARATRSDGERSRRTILLAAAQLATIEGLDGLSIGGLADHIGMSKSGLYAHFGSKEELQLATIETAYEIFGAEVVKPIEAIANPIERVSALCENFIDHLQRRTFAGGCFFAAAAAEFDTHPGPVKQRILEIHTAWMDLLEAQFQDAQDQGMIGPEEDAAQLAFEVDAYVLMANAVFVLKNDEGALTRGRRAVRSRIQAALTPAVSIQV